MTARAFRLFAVIVMLGFDLGSAVVARGVPVGLAEYGGETGRRRGSTVVRESGSGNFALIPIDSSDRTPSRGAEMSVDGTGELSAYVGRGRGGTGPLDAEILFLNRLSGVETRAFLPIASSTGTKLSKDGSRYFFPGAFFENFAFVFGIGMFDLAGETTTLVVPQGDDLFSVDHSGRRIAFQSVESLDPRVTNPERVLQYFFYDEATGEVRQLTTDPMAAFRSSAPTFCPRIFGTTPLITADGNRIVLITSATLGLIEEAPDLGCHIFIYDVGDARWHHAASLPKTISLDLPTLSNDGRFLSFTSIRTDSEGIRRGFPALLDLQTGELTDPIGGIEGFTTFDSVITGDGSTMVISSEADLDPQVGNSDHNLEFFSYDRASGTFAQMTDTVDGVGSTPGGCRAYTPTVSDDGAVVLFGFHLYSVEGCVLDGPLRQRKDGFVFRRVRAVRKRPENQPPTLAAPANAQVIAGNMLAVDFSAEDPDGDPIYYFAQVVDQMTIPPGSDMVDHRDGSATFSWPTTEESVGSWKIRVAAFDEGGGEDYYDFLITVVPPCPGDCDRSGRVTVDELVMAVNIALGLEDLEMCPNLDQDEDEAVGVTELVSAARNGIEGCATVPP